MNFETWSKVLTRISNPADTVLYVYGPDGKLLGWDDDQFESSDSSILDLTLPTSGTYTVEVDSFGDATGNPSAAGTSGDYELFMYRFAAYNPTATTGGGTDTLIAGTGNDTLIGGTGNTKFVLNTSAIEADTLIGGVGLNGVFEGVGNVNWRLTSSQLIATDNSGMVLGTYLLNNVTSVQLTDTNIDSSVHHTFTIDSSFNGNLTINPGPGDALATTGSLNATTNITGSLSQASIGNYTVNGSINSPFTLNGSVTNQFLVTGSVTAATTVTGSIGTAAIDGALTSTGSLNVGGSVTQAYIGSTVNTTTGAAIAPTGQVIGDDLAGRLNVTGLLNRLLVAGGTPGTISATGGVGTIGVFGGFGPIVLQVNDNNTERHLEAAVPDNTNLTGSTNYPLGVVPPATLKVSPTVMVNSVVTPVLFQYFYEGTASAVASNLANPQLGVQLTARVNNPKPVTDTFDLSLVTYNDTAKFNLARLDATGASGIRNVAVEGDLLTTVTATAKSFFGLGSPAGGIVLPSDNLASVAVRDYAPNNSIQAKSIQGLAFGSFREEDGSLHTAAAAKGEDAQDLLTAGTAIVQAGAAGGSETFRVPFADLTSQQQVQLFIDDHGPNFDDNGIALWVESDNGVPSNVARGADTALITVAPTYDKNGHLQNSVFSAIAIRGNGASISTGQSVGSITSTGSLGDVTLGNPPPPPPPPPGGSAIPSISAPVFSARSPSTARSAAAS